MTCSQCKPMYATTEAQLTNRLRNLEIGGYPHPCSNCGSTDWATSREMIEVPEPKRSWRKWPHWRVVMALNIFVAVLCTTLALVTDAPRWLLVFNAVFGGMNVGFAYNTWQTARFAQHLDNVRQAFEQMCELNKAMVENRVEVIVQRMDETEDVPIAPTRH